MKKQRGFRKEQFSHQSFKLEPGANAYSVFDEIWGEIEPVTIDGFCHEGHGYEAHRAGKEVGEIHTCNGFLSPSLKRAKQYKKLVLEDSLDFFARERDKYNRHLRFVRKELKMLEKETA